MASVPCALLVVAAIALIAPALGDVLLSPSDETFFATWQASVRPEPAEQAGYLLSLTAPVLLAAIAMIASGRLPHMRPGTIGLAVQTVQALWTAFALIAIVAQRQLTFGQMYTGEPTEITAIYFTDASWLVALALGMALTAGASTGGARTAIAGWLEDTPARTFCAAAAAVLVIAVWMLHAVNLEATIADAHVGAAYHIQFTLDETYAVLNGRTPLVDFAAQYGSLWPFPVAAVMSVLGGSIGVFTVTMVAITSISLLALFDVLRRAARSAVGGLLLFVPVLATCFFMLRGPAENRYTFATIFSNYPLRMAGPWLLAWLLARHLGGVRPRRAWPLFLAAGLVVLNNSDHGLPALGALVAALLVNGERLTAVRLRQLALDALAGLVAAVALVSLLTLIRGGSLPHPELLVRYAQLYAAAGFNMLPMPTVGFHLVIYLTLVAAIAVAAVRAVGSAPDRLLTGMLMWIGVFGLGSGSYYVGRSHPEVLVASFSAWAVAVALLVVVVVRRLGQRSSVRPEIAEVACLVAFGLMICSVAQTPTPWSQVDRLRAESVNGPLLERPLGQDFIAANTADGEHVAILTGLGHRLAENIGVVNVSPYTGAASMQTESQLDDAITALRDAGGTKVFLRDGEAPPEMVQALAQRGYVVRGSDPTTGVQLLVATGS